MLNERKRRTRLRSLFLGRVGVGAFWWKNGFTMLHRLEPVKMDIPCPSTKWSVKGHLLVSCSSRSLFSTQRRNDQFFKRISPSMLSREPSYVFAARHNSGSRLCGQHYRAGAAFVGGIGRLATTTAALLVVLCVPCSRVAIPYGDSVHPKL